jgi:hypothetical protein
VRDAPVEFGSGGSGRSGLVKRAALYRLALFLKRERAAVALGGQGF